MVKVQVTLKGLGSSWVVGVQTGDGHAVKSIGSFHLPLSTAWKDGEARPTHRKQPTATHWWRTRVDPFADAWPVIEGWLIAEPAVAAHALMDRLAEKYPQAYAGKAQLRTLQRRVKQWRAERAKEMILGRLLKSATPAAHA